MFGSGGSRANPLFDIERNPIPATLKSSLDLVSNSFYNSRMRNLEILYNNEESILYGMMTNYEGQNFCWIQPTRAKIKAADHEYDQYLRYINSKERSLSTLWNPKIGMDCIALYEADSHWYRAVVVSEQSEDRWLVLFIDYGNFQTCTSNQMRQPETSPKCDHFQAPMQALCCRLYNIIPKSPEVQDDIDIYMEQFFLANSRKFLEVKVRNIRQDYVIDCDIFRPKSNDESSDRLRGRHIGQALVNAGLATFADPEAALAGKPAEPEIIDLTDSS